MGHLKQFWYRAGLREHIRTSHQRKNNIGSYAKAIRHRIPCFLSFSLVLPKTGGFQQCNRFILHKHLRYWESGRTAVGGIRPRDGLVRVHVPSQPAGPRVDTNPESHTQKNEPSVFQHSPFGPHGCVSSSHSSTSTRNRDVWKLQGAYNCDWFKCLSSMHV